jgi:hypothetical protein
MAQWRNRLAETVTPAGPGTSVMLSPEAPSVGNASYNWNAFDPDEYVKQNYLEFQADDRKIVQLMRDFFHTHADPGRPVVKGVDVGSGANLYPALAMLPFCQKIDLREYGMQNVAWLRHEVQNGYSELWDPYWEVLSTRESYRTIESPREVLRARAQVRQQNLFELPRRGWDMGTMSFVAESISDQRGEFNDATERFLGALKPGAPFVAAFMRDSSGYYVGTIRFPAVAIREADVEQCLSPLSHDLEIMTVRSDALRREGYHNMIVALGKAGTKRT